MTYRHDIDGLRFFAVAPVVLFHAGIYGFSGGFIGVDVFFVISGYLITGILIRELENGSFNIISFYERRIRRIFPALIAVVFFVCFVAPTALLPSQMGDLQYQIVAAIAFTANILFWMQQDYFSDAAEENPLLHTWSLGLEEQFYILMPIILWLVIRHMRRFLVAILIMIATVSLSFCIYFTKIHPEAAFYLLPFRAWELLVGSSLAAGAARTFNPSRRSREYLAGSGFILLIIAIFTFDSSMGFPGYAAVIPVFASALIIQYAQGTFVGRLLSQRFIVLGGTISYSLYLWHWPLIVFFNDWGILTHAGGHIAVIIASVICAFISWKFIETPFRDLKIWRQKHIFVWSAVGVLALFTTTAMLPLIDGFVRRNSPENIAFDAARNDVSPHRARCHISDSLRDFEDLCRLGTSSGTDSNTLIWSDSHGVELAAAMAEFGLPIIQSSYSSCPPSLSYSRADRPYCERHNEMIISEIENNDTLDTVILVASYLGYPDPEFWEGLQEAIVRISAAGKQAIVLSPVPTFGINIPTYLAAGNREPLAHRPIPPEFYQYVQNVPVVMLAEKLCHVDMCNLIVDGQPLLFDNNHLSMTAVRSIATEIVNEIRQITMN